MTQNKIASLRKEKGWTQEELSEKSEVNVRTIQRLEPGEDGSLDTLKSVANAFQLQISDLFISLDESDKSRQIIKKSQEQNLQISKWKSIKLLYNVITISLFIILMLPLGELMSYADFNLEFINDIIYSLWIAAWPLGFVLIYLVKAFLLIPYLNEKYPLAINLNQNKIQSKNSSNNYRGVIITISVLIFIVALAYIHKKSGIY